MAQGTFRSFIGLAKDTVNAQLTTAVTGGSSSSLPLTNTNGTTGTLTSAGATYSAVIVDGVNTETVACSGNLSAGSIAITGTVTNNHAANVYVYFQLTASIGPTAYIPVTKIDFMDDINQLYDTSFYGSNVRDYTAAQGKRVGKFSIDGFVFADTFGYILATLFGAYDYTGTTGGNPTKYAFSPLNTGNAQPTPYLFYDYNPGANNTRVFAKTICSDLTLTVDPGALMKYSGNFGSIASGVVANPGTIPPVYSSFAVVPSRVATATIGGTATYKVETAEYSFKREEFGPIQTMDGIQDPLAIWAGPLALTAKSTIVVDDDTQLNNYLNGSQPAWVVTANQGTGTGVNGVIIQTTKANYEQTKVVQGGKAWVTVEVPYTALSTTADASTAGGGRSPCLVTLSTSTTTGSTLY